MSDAADPETYLRLAYERMFISAGTPSGMQDDGGVAAIGRACVAAGLLDEPLVRSVFEEYTLAFGLRARSGAHRFRHHFSGGEKTTLSAQRVVVGDFEVGEGGQRMTLRRILFADDATHLDLTGVAGTDQAHRGVVGMGPSFRRSTSIGFGASGQTLALRDDQGVTAVATTRGWSGSRRAWDASFVTNVALSPTTAWVDIDGTRLHLPPRSAAPQVRVEPVEPGEPVKAMLYKEVLNGLSRHGNQDSARIALDTLVATGALPPDDPVIDEVRRITEAFASRSAPKGLGEPWVSLFRRFAKSDGPMLTLPIGAAIDSVAGVSIRFDSLSADPQAFSVALAVSPGLALLQHFPGIQLDAAPLDWWAEDDRHNRYLAVGGNGGGSGALAEGTIEFLAPLDPEARELTLLPTGRHERAVVTIPLYPTAAPS